MSLRAGDCGARGIRAGGRRNPGLACRAGARHRLAGGEHDRQSYACGACRATAAASAHAAYGQPFAACAGPNDVWCIDFKGWFLTGDGTRVDPLTVSDAASRYLLVCQAVGRADLEHVWPHLARAFAEYGLPKAMRSDNGPPLPAAPWAACRGWRCG